MHWLARIALVVAGNALALYLADRLVPGFILQAGIFQLATIALILALLNFFLKPILMLMLSPLIFLTLGLGVVFVNVIVLWLLPIVANHIDFLHGSITIQTIPALIFSTLIISAVNFIIHLAT